MLKNLLNWIILTPSFVITPVLTNVQSLNNQNIVIETNKQYVNQNLVIDNVGNNALDNINPKSGNQDLYLKGPNHDTLHRIFLASDNDRNLPKSSAKKVDDYIIANGNKDHWYDHLIHGLSIDVTKYASSKTHFLKKYKAITFDYFYNYNFWNGLDGWTKQYGKYVPLLVDTVTINLVSTNLEQIIFEATDSSHASNERAKLVFKQEWNGNTLKYSFYLSAWMHWKNGSRWHHNTFASFYNDSYTFVAVPSNSSNKSVKIEKIDYASTFTISSYSEIDLTDFEKQVKEKADQPDIHDSTFKTTNIFVQGYYGTKEVGNVVYVFSILIRWQLGNSDSTLILNGSEITRNITQIYANEQISFVYENSLGKKESAPKSALNPLHLNMQLTGTIYLPILYLL